MPARKKAVRRKWGGKAGSLPAARQASNGRAYSLYKEPARNPGEASKNVLYRDCGPGILRLRRSRRLRGRVLGVAFGYAERGGRAAALRGFCTGQLDGAVSLLVF